MFIRLELPKDIAGIEELTAIAFKDKPYSAGTEHIIIHHLRDAGALSLSLVAEADGEIVGHVAFSKVTINGEDVEWYGLGPISVHPALQKQGIGARLIQSGLARIREMGARGCVLEGDPNYYNRFGFQSYPTLTYAGSPAPEYFMARPFYDTDAVPTGKVDFHGAFYSSE
jgi:putative acetyltransferase